MKNLLFIHVPKSGGTTLRSILRKQYGDDIVCYVTAWSENELISEANKINNTNNKLRVVAGHMIYGIHHYLNGDYKYITLIRNPVERVISDYYYVLQESSHELHDKVVGEGMSIEDYVQSGITIFTDNIQTRMLAGMGKDTPFGACDINMLEKALKNIESQFAPVGITEKFLDSVLILQQSLGWTFPVYQRKNITAQRQKVCDLTQAQIALIVKQNHLDIALYLYSSLINLREIRYKVSRNNKFLLKIANSIYSPAVNMYISTRKLRNMILKRDKW